MKQFKFKKEHLDGTDKMAALMSLLIAKGVITEKEIEETLDVAVEIKNKQLEEERKKNPGAAMFLDMMAGE